MGITFLTLPFGSELLASVLLNRANLAFTMTRHITPLDRRRCRRAPLLSCIFAATIHFPFFSLLNARCCGCVAQRVMMERPVVR
jgi:hypothetical protein